MKNTNYKKYSILLISSLAVLLTSCTTVNPPEYRAQLNKTYKFKKNYYVCEVKDWRPWGSSGVYLTDINDVCGDVPQKMPPIRNYLQNKAAWAAWHNNFDLRYRILGLIGPNTSYRIDNVVVGYEMSYRDITIVSGELTGTHLVDIASGWGTHGEMYGVDAGVSEMK